MGFTLYELNNFYLEILDLIESGADEEEVKEALDDIMDELEHKADSYAIVIKKLEATTVMIKEEEKRLSNRRKSIENHIQTMKSKLEEAMILQDRKKFKTDKFSFGIQKNPMSALILDESKIPEKYKKIVETVNIDKKSMIADFKDSGELIDGVEFKQTESLRIR